MKGALLSLGQTGIGWYVYMIKASDGRMYTGITTDVRRRWSEHSSNSANKRAKFFRGRRPECLLFVIPSASRSTATKEEWAIKSLKRTDKIELIRSPVNRLTDFPELTELE